MSEFINKQPIPKVECFNCRDDTAEKYYRSVFRKGYVFCGECNEESESYMKKLWTHNLKEYLFAKKDQMNKDMQLCSVCFGKSDEQYTRTIFWKRYAFCSGWCQYDFEKSIRKNTR